TRLFKAHFRGVPSDRIVAQPPQQTVDGDVVTVDMPLLLELPDLAISALPADFQPGDTPPEYLGSTPTLPVGHLDIQNAARSIIEGAEHRLDAVRRINDWVFTEVAKEPSVGVPNGLEVLYSKRGDCNEHTALFVSLARAAGIPTRIAAGVVFSERVGPKGQFYYHAWPEVQLGGTTDWVAVDPTFGQLPADATHIKLVEGDLDRQVEILGVIGRLELELIEAR
ncbi:MAG: transglutaminase-like domain-containing protein, partial [Myxococcota bacterium]|nr:transglutaminase-like domain-containing protein [Myxococcota bacterium]